MWGSLVGSFRLKRRQKGNRCDILGCVWSFLTFLRVCWRVGGPWWKANSFSRLHDFYMRFSYGFPRDFGRVVHGFSKGVSRCLIELKPFFASCRRFVPKEFMAPSKRLWSTPSGAVGQKWIAQTPEFGKFRDLLVGFTLILPAERGEPLRF